MLALNKNRARSNHKETVGDQPRIMLFDLSVGGHHPGYIQHLIEYWCEQQLQGQLDIVVSPTFLQKHTDVVEVAARYGRKEVNFVAITAEEESTLSDRSSFLSRLRLAFREWNLVCKYAKALHTTEVFLMYFDTAQLPLIYGQKSPCSVSGIYFRPTFHYSSFGQAKVSRQDVMQAWWERFSLFQLLRSSQLRTLLSLDPFVSEHLDRFKGHVKASYLADPVKTYDLSDFNPEALKATLGIEPGRKVFLFFGALTGRKGIKQLLDAIPLLPVEQCEQLCLLLVGPLGANEEHKLKMQSRLTALLQSLPVQVITHDAFISDSEIQPYFQIADVVLAPYQRHAGMSAILVRAATAQKPVLSADYGLMGEITRRHGLGITVDSASSDAIAQGLTRFFVDAPEQLGDRTKMKQFAEQNTTERFANTIFHHLLKNDLNTAIAYRNTVSK